ncbi:MAG: YibE/F family protein [Clostridia bacterium]|nr:YibE/F family protein [Clostridia bacterium]
MNKKILTGLIIFLILTQILGINISNADEQVKVTEETQENTTQNAEVKKQEIKENVKAKVIEAGKSYERDNGNGGKEYVQNVKVKILEGEEKDEKFDTTYVLTYDLDNKIVGYELKEGNTVYVGIQKENNEIKIIVQDVVRQNYLIGLVIFFFASIILVGRKKGIKAIIGLIITVLAVFIVLLAAIFKGYNAILVSIGTCFIIIVLTFTVIDGWNKKTISAALGTLGGVVLAGIIAIITGYLAKLSGAGKEEAIMLSIASDTAFNFRDLLFAEIIVSALGACMDVGMSIASSLSELKIKNPSISGKELFKSGMNIGGDMIGTMTNTLILSFIGSSLILVLLYMSSQVTFTEVINIEAIATECVCALSGSIGIVYTVPITAVIFSFINRNKEIYKVKSENIIEGKRSLKL